MISYYNKQVPVSELTKFQYAGKNEPPCVAVFVANELGRVRNSAEWLEVYLTYYHGQPVCLYHVLAGVDRSNGYGYAVYGYGYKYGEGAREDVRMKERAVDKEV